MTACAICQTCDAEPDSNVCTECRKETLKGMMHHNRRRDMARRNDKPTLPARITHRCPVCGARHRRAS